jgi:hypothetical protein
MVRFLHEACLVQWPILAISDSPNYVSLYVKTENDPISEKLGV